MAYEIKYRNEDEMKDSGIEWLGKVPKEWEVIHLKQALVDKSGNGFPNELQGNQLGEIPFYKVSDINKNGKYVFKSNNYVSKRQVSKYKWNVISENSILIAKIGEALRKNHRKINKTECIIDNNMLALFVKDGSDIEYWFYILQIIDMDWYTNPGAVPSVNLDKLRNSYLPKCNDNQQQKIANFLDIKTAEFDSIISKKEQLIEKLEEAKKSLISEVVTGKVKIVDGELVDRKPEEMKDSGVEWLGMIPKDWEIKRVKYIVDYIQTGGTPSTSNQEYFDGNINWFNPSDLNNEILYNSERKITRKAIKLNQAKLFFSESILIVGIGATAGKTSYLKVESSFNQQITGMHSKINNNKYIYYAIKNISLELLKLANFTTLPILNNEFIKNIKLCLPNLEEQQKVVEFLNLELIQMDSIITKTQKQITKLKEAKQSLISEAVTGKIDLRDWEIIETGGR